LRKKNNLFPYILQKKISFLFDLLAEWETFFLKEKKEITKPIFISGLPRSGTTLITSIINQHQIVGSYKYKDLPFHRIPLIWNKINKFYYSNVLDEKRLHGDELEVGLNSPDAFEELIWSRHLENYYQSGFSKYLNESYENIKLKNDLIKNMQKILSIRNSDRYLSKGNYNVVRLRYINKIFKDAKFIICFRNPSDTVNSLVKVNEKFNLLEKDIRNFSKNLFELCHFEFGKKRIPLFLNKKNYDQVIDYWKQKDNFNGYLVQWIGLYDFVLKNYIERKSLKVYLMNFDKLLINQDSEIKKILEFCELETSNDQFKNQVIFKKTSEYNRNSISTENKEKVNLIFQKLLLAESDQ
tara:strand:- start:1463 stop:2524 length:1062 start_codon:yes stop_codon:yes gene_type:complete